MPFADLRLPLLRHWSPLAILFIALLAVSVKRSQQQPAAVVPTRLAQ